MKEYIFNFKEVNHGMVIIMSETKPTHTDVIATIMKGKAYFKDTEYKDIKMINPKNKER